MIGNRNNFIREVKSFSKIIALSTTCFIATNGIANAASLDYGSMESLFGEPVTTSANGSPMRASDAPLNMKIISAEEIARFPATEIPDIIRHYAGVTVRQNSTTDYTVGIRGYNQPSAERLLILVNGRQVYADYYGLVNWSSIPVELGEIRQIEIIKGPNTALFGFNATSGVINIVTYDPLYDDVDYVEGNIGTNGYYKGVGAYTIQDPGKWGMRISYNNRVIDENDDVDSVTYPSTAGLRDDSRARNFNTEFSAKLNPKATMRFEMGSSATNNNVASPFNSWATVSEDFKYGKGNLNVDTKYGIVDATIYRNAIDSRWGGFMFDNDLTSFQLSNTYKINASHTARFAYEYRNNLVSYESGGIAFGETNYNIQSYSGLWYWNINDKLDLSVAARYDHVDADYDENLNLNVFFTDDEYNVSHDEIGYNLGLVYKATDIDTFRFTTARGVDLPSPFEYDFQISSTLAGDPSIDVSSIYDFQIGYERVIDRIKSNLYIDLFYQITDGAQRVVDHTNPIRIVANSEDTSIYGFDIGLDGRSDNGWRWGLSYGYSELEDDQPVTYSGTINYEDLHSNHKFTSNLGYSPNEQWDYDLFVSYESEFNSARVVNTTISSNGYINYEVDPDFIIDAKVRYRPVEDLEVSLNGQALLGDHEESHYGIENESLLFLGLKYQL